MSTALGLALATPCAAQIGFQEHVLTSSAQFANSVSAGDVNGDGSIDILATSSSDDTIRWFENDGADPPTFTEHVVTTALNGAWHVIAADVDADGIVDLVSAARDANRVSWWESDGATPPGFVEHVVDTGASGSYSVVAADLDGDGDTDLAQASINDNTVAWYESDGQATPTFTKHVIAVGVNFAASIDACDADGDGDIDLFSASFFDDTVAMYDNDGAADPTFTKIDVSTSTDGARAVVCADVNGAGGMDLVACAFSSGNVYWFRNTGGSPATFKRKLIFNDAPSARSVAVGDVDGDGDADVLAASGADNSVRWFENDGTTVPDWTAHLIVDDASNSYFVAAADINGDGDLDVLSASSGDATVRWLEQVAWVVTRFCTATVNSTGSPASIDSEGTGSIAANDLVLVTAPVPAGQFGLFLFGPEEVELPFGDGFRCVGDGGMGIFRLPVMKASAGGAFLQPLDYTTNPAQGNIVTGSTWKFQAWFRDPPGGPAGFNFSDGLSILFSS